MHPFVAIIEFTQDNQSFIIMDAPPERENIKSFIHVDKILLKNNFSAPRIYAIDDQNCFCCWKILVMTGIPKFYLIFQKGNTSCMN
eukprot:UN32038